MSLALAGPKVCRRKKLKLVGWTDRSRRHLQSSVKPNVSNLDRLSLFRPPDPGRHVCLSQARNLEDSRIVKQALDLAEMFRVERSNRDFPP